MKKQVILFIIPVVFLWACKATKKVSSDNNAGNIELITSDNFKKPIKDKELFKTAKDAVLIDTVYITNDSLTIQTKKITGCDADNFSLIWNGDLGKSSPPQASLKLFQLVDPACKEHHKFRLVFNISPLKLKGDTASDKTTQIKVGGWAKVSSYSHN